MATNNPNLNQNTIDALMGIQSTLSQLSQALKETYAPGTQVPSSISDPLKALLGGPSSGSSGGGYYTPPKNNYQNSYYSAPPTPPSLSSSTSAASYSTPSGAATYSTPSTTVPSSAIQSSYTGSSIVDYLNLTGQPSDFSSRAKLAQQYGIPNYTGTAAQNTQLLNLLRSGSTPSGTSAGTSAGGYYTPPKNNYQNSYYSAPPVPPKKQPSAGGNKGIKVTGGYQPLNFGIPGSLDTTIPTANTTQSYISKPVSGMANEIVSPNDKKGKSNQEQIVTQFLANQKVPTRQSLWDTIKGMLGTPSSGQLSGGILPTATPVINKVPEITQPANVPSPAQRGLTTEQYQQGIGSHPTTTSPMGGIYSQYTSDVTSTQINLGGKENNPEFAPINDMTTQLLDLIKQSTLTATQLLEEASKAALRPETTQEDIQKMVEQAQTTAQNLTPAIQPIISQLDVIDKAIADASIGFRKAAEDIRNNPDISVWQQDRRLRELDDLQNYAPLLYGLSLKDLINYRSQLADKVNYWTTQYNNIFDKAMGLVDTSTPGERLERSAQFSTKALEQLQGLAALLIPTYSYQEYTDNYGNVIRITYKTDPVTGQQTEVGRVNLGQLGQGLSTVLRQTNPTNPTNPTGGNNETGGGSTSEGSTSSPSDLWESL